MSDKGTKEEEAAAGAAAASFEGSGSITEVDDPDEFEAKLKAAGDRVVVVDFHAAWCKPCQKLGPALAELAKSMTDVEFLAVDVDDMDDVAEDYEVSGLPTVLWFRGGKEVGRSRGFDEGKTVESIKTAVEAAKA